jgi:hypothetical protein
MQGVYVAQPWAVVWHFKFDNQTANWSQQSTQQLADSIRASWATNFSPLCANAVHFNQVVCTDIGSTTPVVGTNTTVAPGTSGAGVIENSSLCALVNMHINARYRGGHPRSYLPLGYTTAQLNESQWTVGFQGQVATGIANFINSVRLSVAPVNGSAVSQVIPRYTYTLVNDSAHQRYIRQRTGLKAVDVVQTYTCNPTYGVQRRRLRA